MFQIVDLRTQGKRHLVATYKNKDLAYIFEGVSGYCWVVTDKSSMQFYDIDEAIDACRWLAFDAKADEEKSWLYQ